MKQRICRQPVLGVLDPVPSCETKNMSSTCFGCFGFSPIRSNLQKLISIPRTFSLGAQGGNGAKTLIIDTDAGFDDLLAITCLENNNVVEIPLIVTVGGIQNDPTRASRFINKLFPRTSQVVPGGNNQNEFDPVPGWLHDFRKILDLMMLDFGIERSNKAKKNKKNEANVTAIEVEKFLKNQSGSVDLMCLGPLTNVAAWIDSDETRGIMEEKVDKIWIMGGNIPGSIAEPEFNFKSDAGSMSKVLHHKSFRDKIFVVPAESCKRHPASKNEWDALVEQGRKGNGVISKVLSADASWDNLKYDLLCAFAYAKYEVPNGAIESEILNLSIDANSGLLSKPTFHTSDDIVKINFVTEISVNGTFG